VTSEVDTFVGVCHTEPVRAESILGRSPDLAHERSSWGETSLEAASHLGHRRLAVKLLEMGVDSDAFVECSLGDAGRAAAALESCGREMLGVHQLPILHFAVVSHDPGTVERLLEAGAPVNSPCAALSPLHTAVACKNIQIARLLLQAGANPLAVDPFGDTAVDWAMSLEGAGSVLVAMLVREARRLGSGDGPPDHRLPRRPPSR
jgi:ankyrin repeat protein